MRDTQEATVMKFTLLAEDGSAAGVELIAADGGGYDLVWTDFVANNFIEFYDRLDAAIARVALLATCASKNWWPSFNYLSEGHQQSYLSWADANIDFDN